jgi:hypothetical protein
MQRMHPAKFPASLELYRGVRRSAHPDAAAVWEKFEDLWEFIAGNTTQDEDCKEPEAYFPATCRAAEYICSFDHGQQHSNYIP